MQYRILASDFDNTLVPFGDAGPSAAVVGAVNRIQKLGARFVLCTGRALPALRQSKKLLGGLHYDFAVCANGAHVVDAEDRTLDETPLTAEEMYALVDVCEDYDYPLQFPFSDAYYAYVGYEQFCEFNAAHSGAGLITLGGEDQDRHLIDMPRAACVTLPVGALEQFREKYGHLGLAFLPMANLPGENWISYDVMRGGVDKSTGLAHLCAELGVPMTAVVVVPEARSMPRPAFSPTFTAIASSTESASTKMPAAPLFAMLGFVWSPPKKRRITVTPSLFDT